MRVRCVAGVSDAGFYPQTQCESRYTNVVTCDSRAGTRNRETTGVDFHSLLHRVFDPDVSARRHQDGDALRFLRKGGGSDPRARARGSHETILICPDSAFLFTIGIMNDPLAYFLTWTTYGTWLPGDNRGWIKRNESGVQSSEPGLKKLAKQKMTEERVILSQEQRLIVDQQIRAHADHRAWNILALNVRTNHVHLVIEAHASPEEVMRQMKMWCTQKLKQSTRQTKWWTKNGDCKLLFTEEAVENVVRYTLEGQ